jgi:hypothetical protein
MIELTVFTKAGGPLTKQILLASDGSIKADGSACVMSRGAARRFRFDSMQQFADLISGFQPNEALAVGTLRADLPDEVQVVAKRNLNGATRPEIIARTRDYISYRPREPALAPIDFDQKGMPPPIAAKIDKAGGFWAALTIVLPQLETVARVERASTSAGLFDARNGQPLEGSGGRHVYVLVQDGADIERFLKTLHDRCWLAGFDWMMVGAGGQLLERSIVDRVNGTPERMVFEGAPILVEPVRQDFATRKPVATADDALDTATHCRTLTVVELAKIRELRATEAHRLAGDRAKAREAFVRDQARRLGARMDVDPHQARRIIERQCEGVLLPDVILEFDDPELTGATVGDMLNDPNRFVGEILADPLEGIEYGRGKAQIMRRADGSLWINSFAHGRTVYELKRDFAAVAGALDRAAKDEVVVTFVRLVVVADLQEDEIERLKHLAADRAGVGVRALAAALKQAQQKQKKTRAQLEIDQRIAERRDPRPQIPAPPGCAMAAADGGVERGSGRQPRARAANARYRRRRRTSARPPHAQHAHLHCARSQ